MMLWSGVDLKFSVVLALLFFILGSTLSSCSDGYEEQITLAVVPKIGFVGVELVFINVDGPLNIWDLERPDLIMGVTIIGIYSPDGNSTLFMASLNAALVNKLEGRLMADSLKEKFEDVFNVTVPYVGNYTQDSMLTYRYETDECPIQRFREQFLKYTPSHGFGELVTPSLLENYERITFSLKRDDGGLSWTNSITVSYYNYFETEMDREYTISLRELANYSDVIWASPQSSKSTVIIAINQVDEEFQLISIETTPSRMEETKTTPEEGVTIFRFEKTITSSNINDLSIRFKVVPPRYDYTPIIIAISATAAALGIIGFMVRRKRRTVRELGRVG